jgi:hypothetical protein
MGVFDFFRSGKDSAVHVVDDTVFLLGLDILYTEAMRRHESTELLDCARHVASVLRLPRDSAVGAATAEGYYAQDAGLAEYFHLVRSLQDVDEARAREVEHLAAFQRLLAVASSPLYGAPQSDGKLLPVGRDPLSMALHRTAPDWRAAQLVSEARALATEGDDFSLVGLAAIHGDPVVLTALRESVVLYAETVVITGLPPVEFAWRVSPALTERAARFVRAFNELFAENLPAPTDSEAATYWHAYRKNRIAGRCVRLGFHKPRALYYHWAVKHGAGGRYVLDEFWDKSVWTTARYRKNPYR